METVYSITLIQILKTIVMPNMEGSRRRTSSTGELSTGPKWTREEWREEKRRLEEERLRARLDSQMSFSIDGGSILEVQREHRRLWEETKLACEERKAFLEEELGRIRDQEVRLRVCRIGIRGELDREEKALEMANSQLAKFESMLPGGADSWALQTSAACGCQGACNCIQVI